MLPPFAFNFSPAWLKHALSQTPISTFQYEKPKSVQTSDFDSVAIIIHLLLYFVVLSEFLKIFLNSSLWQAWQNNLQCVLSVCHSCWGSLTRFDKIWNNTRLQLTKCVWPWQMAHDCHLLESDWPDTWLKVQWVGFKGIYWQKCNIIYNHLTLRIIMFSLP